MDDRPAAARGAVSRGALLLLAFAAACVLVPGLFWWGTTFTRRLDDAALAEHLASGAAPRDVQHAIEELSRRFQEGRPAMDRWAEDLVRVSRRPESVVRVGAAWCMQFDASRPEFVARLRELVEGDPSVMVRRNAATSLAKGGDATGLPVLREMLLPFDVNATTGGTAEGVVAVGRPVEEGLLVARIRTPGGTTVDVRSPVPGTVAEALAEDGAAVRSGDVLVRLRPAADHAENALVALALVGTPGDAALARTAADPRSGLPDDVRAAASWAAEAIERRASGE